MAGGERRGRRPGVGLKWESLAEGRGFEPRRGFHPNTLSRRAP